MTLRNAVLAILGLSILYSAAFWPQIARTANEVVSLVVNNPELLGYAALSAVILLGGHGLRAYRDTILFSKAACTSIRAQFAAFAAGSFCNAILPLRIGELIRADVIAQHYKISFSFSFVLICVERLVDVIILGLAATVLLGFNLPLTLAACVLLLFILLIWSPPRMMKRALNSCGRFLNDRTEAKILFTFWSLEYGLKRTLQPRLLGKYVAVSVLNWAVYVAALCPTIAFLFGWEFALSGSVGVFTALTSSLAPGALGSFTPSLAGFGFDGNAEMILLWAIAIVPTAIIGLTVSLVGLQKLPLFRPKRAAQGDADLDNKLSRNTDISADQLGFMKDYYGGKDLARRIARQEVEGGPALARYFTAGGSGAITYQSKAEDGVHVTKLVSQDHSKALRAQYRWLKEHASPNVVRALAEHEEENAYSIDIEYESSTVDLFTRLHERTLTANAQVMDEVIAVLAENVWKVEGAQPLPPDEARSRVRGYIDKHITESLSLAADALPSLKDVMDAEKLVVNGEVYPNLDELLTRVIAEDIMEDLCAFRVGESLHGDLIIDNLIYSETKGLPILLDPVPEGNFFDGPVFDFGKLSQSLQIGYEFMLRNRATVKAQLRGDGSCVIDFDDDRSAVYEELWRYIHGELAPRFLTECEQRTMLFIGATNYFRRMKHQVVQCPQNALKFYAQGIRYLTAYTKLFD